MCIRDRAWVPSRDLGSDREEPTPAVIYTGDETRPQTSVVSPSHPECHGCRDPAALVRDTVSNPEPAASASSAPIPCTSLPLSRSKEFKLARWKRIFQRIMQQGLQEPGPLSLLRREALLQLIADRHQFIHLGHDAVLFREGRQGNSEPTNHLA